MMKIRHFLLFAIIFFVEINVFTQTKPNLTINKEPKLFEKKSSQNESVRLSPMTNLFLDELNTQSNRHKSKSDISDDFKQKYLIKTSSRDHFVGGLIKVSGSFDERVLQKMGITIGTKAGNIWTVRIPILQMEKIIILSGIEYIQIDESITKKLDNARITTWVDWVQEGYLLPQKYLGENVVIGIIDGGFDYTHPNFYDTTYSNYRVKRVWEQMATSGSSPSGYSYGRELTTQIEMLNAQTDTPTGTHGTHVAGIAAGSGSGTNGKYRGVAPASDIILVSVKGPLATGQSVVIDAINYIFSYAKSVGKPAVINMSLGTHIGPHDGTSLFDHACDNLVGNGKILVGAAGNEGDTPLHLEYNFTSTDTSFITFVDFEDTNNQIGLIDIWGQAGKDFWIDIALYDPSNQSISDETLYWSPSEEALETIYLIGSDYDTCTVTLSTNSSEFNNEPRFFTSIQNKSNDKVLLAGYGKDEISGTINIWNHGIGHGASLTNGGESWAIAGNTDITVGEIGGTGKSIISVGAYNTTETLVGGIASFSSKGPTVDGRIKPDISAPGNRISSSVSRFDDRYLEGGSRYSDVIYTITNGTDNWSFAKMQGTSMASPMVTGIIALLLEASPTLTSEDIKQLFMVNSWTDDNTGAVPNNIWGYGKIDAHESMKAIVGGTYYIGVSIIPVDGGTITGIGNYLYGATAELAATSETGYDFTEWTEGGTTVSADPTYSFTVNSNRTLVANFELQSFDITASVIPVDGGTITGIGNYLYGATAELAATSETGYDFTEWTEGGTTVSADPTYSFTVNSNRTLVANFDELSNILKYEKDFVTIYPNPTADFLYIKLKNQTGNRITVKLFSFDGKLLQISKDSDIIDMGKYSSGVYFIEIEIEGVRYMKKLIKNE